MPEFSIEVSSAVDNDSFRVAAVKGSFDLTVDKTVEKFEGNIPLDWDWTIGLICGASGTGKTTIIKHLFPDKLLEFEYNGKAVMDDMPEHCSIEDITMMFSSVGFASTPSWLKPYSVLSNGERMRVDVARALLTQTDLVVFDEFTSVVDRHVAQIGSHCVQRSVRRNNDKKFVAVSCHYDIEEWLRPDWVFDTNGMTFRRCDVKKKDQTSSLRFTQQIKERGKFLESITI